MTNKLLSGGKIFQYYVPVTLILFTFLTIERTVKTDGGYDRLYGLPLPWISGASAYNMFHFHVYLVFMVLNLLFYFGLTVLLFEGLSKSGLKLKVNLGWQFLSGILILLLIFLFYARTFDSDFHLMNDDYYWTTGRKIVIGF
jgi:hypothetical protein